MAAALQLGRIIWAELADANAIRKVRPAVIVTPTERISPTTPLHVVAITSRLSQPLPDDHVVLPWHAQGHPRTGLNRKCAAVCTWLAEISSNDIRDIGGLVPAPLMLEILTKIGALTTRPLQPNSDANSGPPASA